jgi:hypothetical protein
LYPFQKGTIVRILELIAKCKEQIRTGISSLNLSVFFFEFSTESLIQVSDTTIKIPSALRELASKVDYVSSVVDKMSNLVIESIEG